MSGNTKCFFCESNRTQELKLESVLDYVPEGLTRGIYEKFEGYFCKNCKSIQNKSVFKKELYVDGFYSASQNYDRDRVSYDYSGSLLDFFYKFEKNSKFLDFGAGQGTTALYLQQCGYDVDIIEPDKGYQILLKNNFPKCFNDLSQLSEKYDLIYSIAVLEHLEDIKLTIEQLSKNLKTGGFLIFQYPNPEGLTARLNLHNWDMLFEPGHILIPSKKAFEDYVKKNINDLVYYNSFTSSVLSRGRIPFYPGRLAKIEKSVKYLCNKSKFFNFLYKLMWKIQDFLSLGETKVIIFKKVKKQ